MMTTKQELEELLQDVESWEEYGVPLSEASIKYALAFAEGSNFTKNPDIEIHPDGQVAFTWRLSGTGILNIAFNEEGWATWAVYYAEPKEHIAKGKFQVLGNERMSTREKPQAIIRHSDTELMPPPIIF